MTSQAKTNTGGRNTYLLDPILWNDLQHAESIPIFCQSWLQIQCSMIYGVVSGVVLWKESPDKAYAPVAFYPYRQEEYRRYKRLVETVVYEKKGVVLRVAEEETGLAGDSNFLLGYPVMAGSDLCGIAGVETSPRDNISLQAEMRTLQWGIAWLENYVRKTRSQQKDSDENHLQAALDLIARVLQGESFKTAATEAATELAGHFSCHRVSIGFLRRKRTKLFAISNSAFFRKQMNLVGRLESAMDESADQKKPLWLPESRVEQNSVTRAHRALLENENTNSVCTIPILDAEEKALGAVTFERCDGPPFEADSVASCESIVSLVGPILNEKRENARWLPAKIFHSFDLQCRKIFGPGHLGLKLGFMAILGLVLFFSFARGDYRVTAKTVLEGEVQRAVVAPFNGYIADANISSGDVVESGQVLYTLDDRDLRLERLDAVSRREQYAREMRKAMAANERAQVNILQQQIAQADARAKLLSGQIARAAVKAPFDGLIVTGDLSQMLGAPVEKGEVIFEITPLNTYRVILEVDEADIRDLEKGQTGKLILTSLPKTKFNVVLEKITPVTTAKEGRSFFTVEASLESVNDDLRPGMEGYCKIFIDRRKLAWIWTHDLLQWARLKLWYLLP